MKEVKCQNFLQKQKTKTKKNSWHGVMGYLATQSRFLDPDPKMSEQKAGRDYVHKTDRNIFYMYTSLQYDKKQI